MQIFKWEELDADGQKNILARASGEAPDIAHRVREIISAVRRDGNRALRDFTARYDGYDGPLEPIPAAKLKEAVSKLSPSLRKAIDKAMGAITVFHHAQEPASLRVETLKGVVCEKVWRSIERIGLYVPGGTAPYFSAVIMLAVPAQLAGCKTRIICTPPAKDGSVNSVILAAAQLCGIDQVWPIGGAQAIAAMAFGTESIPKADKIFGPGNAYVTEAKQQVSQMPDGAAIDMPAGPSEVMLITDGTANPAWVAADLLAQAEHNPDSQALCVTTDRKFAEAVQIEVKRQSALFSRAEFINGSLRWSRIIVAQDLAMCVTIANRYAPEHLILQIENASSYVSEIQNAGSVFIGPWSPETAGDYASGTNHVLPTYGYARAYSGLNLLSFMKSMTVQTLTREGLAGLAPSLIALAKAEGLDAHAAAVSLRLEAP